MNTQNNNKIQLEKAFSSSANCLVIGENDLSKRLRTLATSYFSKNQIELKVLNSSEARSEIISNKPDIVLFQIDHDCSKKDLIWMKKLLEQIRDRFQSSIYIICAVNSAKKFVLAGDLLFNTSNSLEPSGLINDFIITPPPGFASVYSLSEQFLNSIEHYLHLKDSSTLSLIPAFWEKTWIPAMADPASREIWFRWLPRYAKYTNENPLIIGPTGSGKTRLAASLHSLSQREGPFISITPRDFSSSELVQAELFGAVAGAYTGAVDKWGLVKKAEKGTLFIDELQSIDLDLQGKLITFIENKSYRRVGEAESQKADVRFIFATNRPLAELVSEGKLRDDFAYRLERLQINLPALKDRKLDIAAACCFGLAKVLRERNKSYSTTSGSIEGFSTEAYRTIFSSAWPGNLRQLENTLAKLIELADMKALREIDSSCTATTLHSILGYEKVESQDIYKNAALEIALNENNPDYDSIKECLEDFSEKIRFKALEVSGGEVSIAAKLIKDIPKALQLFINSRKGVVRNKPILGNDE